MGLLFLRAIGLIEAIDYKIGFENNRMDGLIQIKDNQTPTNNPQANERHFTNERTKK